MKPTFAVLSLLLFGISVILLFTWTAAESAFVNMSAIVERLVTFAMLVLPAGIGAALGALSIRRKEDRNRVAISGIILNTLFALFHLLIVLFAG